MRLAHHVFCVFAICIFIGLFFSLFFSTHTHFFFFRENIMPDYDFVETEAGPELVWSPDAWRRGAQEYAARIRHSQVIDQLQETQIPLSPLPSPPSSPYAFSFLDSPPRTSGETSPTSIASPLTNTQSSPPASPCDPSDVWNAEDLLAAEVEEEPTPTSSPPTSDPIAIPAGAHVVCASRLWERGERILPYVFHRLHLASPLQFHLCPYQDGFQDCKPKCPYFHACPTCNLFVRVGYCCSSAFLRGWNPPPRVWTECHSSIQHRGGRSTVRGRTSQRGMGNKRKRPLPIAPLPFAKYSREEYGNGVVPPLAAEISTHS